jgi:hypothetical protein
MRVPENFKNYFPPNHTKKKPKRFTLNTKGERLEKKLLKEKLKRARQPDVEMVEEAKIHEQIRQKDEEIN